MCGIVGAIALGRLPKTKEAERQRIMRILTTELLLLTEERGKDATGAVVLFEDGNFYGEKRGVEASSFLSVFGTSSSEYGGLIKVWEDHKSPVKAFLGHCRAATAGNKEDNVNNHPIKVNNLVGVHNGTLKNDDVIFDSLKCKRDGSVDSEAILRLASHYTNGGKEPFTTDNVFEVMRRLDGSFAVVMFNADNPFQIALFRDGRPLEFVFLKEMGILFLVSELKFWESAHCRYERIVNYYGVKLPTLLHTTIEKRNVEVDNVHVIDITINTTKDTKIDDLFKKKKIVYADRIWKTKTYVSANYSKPNSTTTENKAIEKTPLQGTVDEKRETTQQVDNKDIRGSWWVFNRDKKQFFLQIDGVITDITVIGSKEATNTTVDNGPDIKQTTNDVKPTEVSVAEIVDLTNYREKMNKSYNEKEDYRTQEKNDIVIVDMKQEDVKTLELLEQSYVNLPNKKKGFSNTDDVLDVIGVQDEETAKKFTLIVLANRIFKHAWKTGFLNRLKSEANAIEKDKTKDTVREQHIVNLKILSKTLIKFYGAVLSQTEDTKKYRLLMKKVIDDVDENDKLRAALSLFNRWEVVDVTPMIRETDTTKDTDKTKEIESHNTQQGV